MRAPLVFGLVAATALVAAAAVLLGGGDGGEPGTATPSPLAARLGATPPPAPAAASGAAPAPAAEPVVNRENVPAPEACDAAAEQFLRRAGLDRSLAVVTAEILAVGSIERGLVGEGDLEHQDVRLRLLTDSRDRSLRRYAVVEAPLVPAASLELHGCRTPFGALAVGQVRTVVLGRGRPDGGALARLLGHRARWLVLAGPEVERPADPVLALVPSGLHDWLGRPAPTVFRARVAVMVAGQSPPAGQRDLAREFGRLEVDVLQVVQQGSGRPVRARVRLAPEPFAGRLDTASLVVGSEWWFVSEDLGLIHVLRAFAPVR